MYILLYVCGKICVSMLLCVSVFCGMVCACISLCVSMHICADVCVYDLPCVFLYVSVINSVHA